MEATGGNREFATVENEGANVGEAKGRVKEFSQGKHEGNQKKLLEKTVSFTIMG